MPRAGRIARAQANAPIQTRPESHKQLADGGPACFFPRAPSHMRAGTNVCGECTIKFFKTL